MTNSRERIGLIAGTGSIAAEFVTRAHEKDCDVAVVALSQAVQENLKDIAQSTIQLAPTQPKKMIRFFHDEGVRRFAFAGKVEKNLLFQGLKFDLDALRFVYRARDMADMTIRDRVVEYAKENDLEVLPQTEFLDHLLAPPGPIGKKSLKKSHLKDARYGIRLARETAALDIGQTVVVRKGAVVAVEAIEGTDEAIRRGCELAGKDAVICKVARPNQDPRFDIPGVGPKTVRTACEGSAAALIVEAGTTFLIEKETLIQEADAAGIALVGWTNDEER
jgi:DUF1009 family protein